MSFQVCCFVHLLVFFLSLVLLGVGLPLSQTSVLPDKTAVSISTVPHPPAILLISRLFGCAAAKHFFFCSPPFFLAPVHPNTFAARHDCSYPLKHVTCTRCFVSRWFCRAAAKHYFFALQFFLLSLIRLPSRSPITLHTIYTTYQHLQSHPQPIITSISPIINK